METAKDINLSSVRYRHLSRPVHLLSKHQLLCVDLSELPGAGEVPEEETVRRTSRKFRVRATRGMRDGSTVVIAGRGVQRCGMLVGDVIVRIKELPARAVHAPRRRPARRYAYRWRRRSWASRARSSTPTATRSSSSVPTPTHRSRLPTAGCRSRGRRLRRARRADERVLGAA